jgi:hypothetical protein
MALLGPDQNVYLTQLALGLANTLLLFYLGWQVGDPARLGGKAWLGGAVALAHTLNLGQLFFEADLLTETPTTFWILLSLAGIALWLYNPSRRSIGLACGLGVTSTAAALTRPLFIFLPFLMLLFLIFDGRRLHFNFQALKRAIAFCLPVAILFGMWLNFIHSRFHDWALTTMTGYHLVQHTGSYFEYVPDKYAALRDTYIKYRNAQVAQHGTPANAIWDAIPEMTAVSGMTFFDLNRTLARISTQLILEHPDLYLKNCLEGWWMFWRTPFYWSQDSFHWQGTAAVVQPVIWIERLVFFSVNLLFITLSLGAAGLAVWPKKAMAQKTTAQKTTAQKTALQKTALQPGVITRLRSIASSLPTFMWFLAGSIWIASLLQTFLDHGDNPRFLVPLQSLVVLWVLWFGWRFFKRTASVE